MITKNRKAWLSLPFVFLLNAPTAHAMNFTKISANATDAAGSSSNASWPAWFIWIHKTFTAVEP